MGRERRFDISTDAEGLVATATQISIGSYEQWRGFFFSETEATNDSISGLNADPDFDGLTNLSEYLHGTLPMDTSESPFSFSLSDPHSLMANVQWAKGVSDYEWDLESSIDLKAWNSLTFTSQLQAEFSDFEFFQVEASIASPSSDKVFYRFIATPTTP